MAGAWCTLLCQLMWIVMYTTLVSGEEVLHFSVAEEMPAGTFVGSVIEAADLTSQHDAETLQEFRYGLLPPSGEDEVSLLAIDMNKGIITTKSRIDREQICPRKVKCSLYLDVTVSGLDNIQTIGVWVDIEDINDNKPSFPERRITLEIPESSPAGISFNLPLATDLDSPALSIQNYDFVSEVTVFELKVITVVDVTRNLQLILKDKLDREQREVYQVTLMANDGGQPPRSGFLHIDVVIADSNDHSPEFVKDSYEISIPENFAVKATILSIQAHDQDIGVNGQVTYHIVPSPDSVNANKFGIIEATGDIFAQESLDFETQKVHDLVVEARDGGVNSQPAYASVTIHVEDVNDNAPQITVNTLGEKDGGNGAAILETAEAGTFVAHFLVRDLDAGHNGNFSCNLQEPHFYLRQQQRSQYRLVTASGLDRENQEYFHLTVLCRDYGLPSLSSSVEISVQVLDVNDNSPIFSEEAYSVTLPENNPVGAFLLRVNSTDLDLGINAQITYHLGDEAKDKFKIDPHTGEITAIAVFDFEKQKVTSFMVTAVDGGSPPLSSSVLVSVSIQDTNDEAPQFYQQHYTFEVQENQPKGFEIGTVSAVDLDSEPFNHFEFLLLPSSSASLFYIDPKSGRINTQASLDHEVQAMYIVTVVASNTGKTLPLSSSATITVQVLDGNDNAPIIIFPSEQNHTVTVSNMVPVGYHITQVQAFDADQGNNAALKYAMDDRGQDTGFYIDSSTGVVSTGMGLQNFDTQVFEVEVIVTDLGVPPKASKQILSISVNHSIAFIDLEDETPSGISLTLVAALTATCSTILLILIVVIVVLRCRQTRKGPKHVYQCRIEEQKVTEAIERRRNSTRSEGKSPYVSTGCEAKLDKNVKNDVGNIYVSHQTCRNNHLNNRQTQPAGVTTVHTEEDVPLQTPWISVGTPQRHSTTSVPIHIQNKLWELSVKDMQGNQKRLSHRDQDTDSAYSGDTSNPDSGRGASEETDNQGDPCYGCHGNQESHRTWTPRSSRNFNRNIYGSKHQIPQTGIHGYHEPQMINHSNNPNASWMPDIGCQVVPPGESYHGYQMPSQGGHNQAGYMYDLGDNYSVQNCHLERPVTPSEDFSDNASTTSGSYIIDSSDVYQEAFETTSYLSAVV